MIESPITAVAKQEVCGWPRNSHCSLAHYTRLGARGIYSCQMDADTGEVGVLAVTGGIENPSFLALDPAGEHLYAVCETTDESNEGAVSAYSINEDRSLTFLNRESTGGPGPCHLAVDLTDSYVIAANYAGGSVCMLPIERNGALQRKCDFVQHEGSSINAERQQEATRPFGDDRQLQFTRLRV